ncbi:TBC1 domain family member 1 [Aplysia californica]|uniref:TBC1 domain family member 1 n=1 Tax=Aplysia californica TaxID=6500 RepID=A0ABM1A924_APLCA|nr:TBC1 domain family member 1 [Aplysia californica]
MLLMHMEEISAFHVLKYMMYDLGLRKQFRPNMMALQIKLYQLTRLLHDQYKDLYEHFEMHEISPTLYAAPWFLTLFASQFPLGFVARVFDMMFVQGIDALFKVALMLLGNHRALILQCNSFESTVDFLKTTLPEMVQVQMERIINQAFELDISKELQAYDVEYHVLSEEMSFSPALLPHHHHNHRNSNSHRHHSLPQQHNSPSLQHQAMQHVHHHHHHAHVAKSSLEDRPTRLVDRRRSSIDIEMLSRLEQQNRGLKQQNMDLLEKLQHSQSQQRSYEHSVHAHQIEQDKLRSHVRTLELERAALLSAVAKLRKLVPRAALQNLHLTLPQLPPTTPSPTSSSSSPGFPGSEPESVGPSEEGILSSNVRGDVEAPDGGQKSESRDGNMEKASATFIGDNSAGGLFSSEENTGDLSAKPCSNVEGSSVNTLSGASAEVSSQRGLSSQTTPSGAATTPTIARRPRELSDKNVLSSSSVVSESSLSEQSGPWSTPSMHSSSTGAAQSRNAPRGSGHRDEDNKPAGPRSLPHDAAGSGR